jgi:RNA polymerase sigma factor (sigma-70 family)
MDDDSRVPPDPQVFWLCNGCLVLFSCEPEAPARDPPRASEADRAACALVAHTPLVRGELRRWGVPERDVPDLVQNVLLDVLTWWTNRWLAPAARVEAELVTYVRVVARRAAMRHGRRRSKRRERLECEMALLFALDEPDPAPSPEEAILAAQAKRALWDLLSPESLSQLLGRPLWHIFREYAVLRLPVKWIAEGNGVPVATIYNRVRLARDLLCAALRRRRAALRSRRGDNRMS